MESTSKKLAIFPAAGGLGTSTSTHLLKLVDPSQIILIARYPEKIPAHVKDTGVTIRKADYDHAETLEHAFDGVWCLNLISYPSIQNEHRAMVHKRAISAARHSGVSHIIYSSLAFGGACTPHSTAHVMQPHLSTEAHLSSLTAAAAAAATDKAFTYTAVREGLYSESFPIYTGFFNLKSPTTEIAIPHDGSGPGIAWAKQDELGEATARLIASYAKSKSPTDFSHTNKIILLSGPRAISLSETVKILGKATGNPQLHIRPVSVEKYSELPQVRAVWPKGGSETPEQWATSFEAIRRGETAVVTPLLAEILGRDPEPFEKTVEELTKKSV
ncbi:MAG: hypothetical protein M1834_009519 [Cirrosporium novae-zelandiae]|nr:MAG: hypothetical protein M1834_009519 [Cirrosporium novae-zelandiae]